MSRQEDFIEAGIQYRMEHGKPMAIGGDNFADVAKEMNRCKDFEAGAEYGYQYAVDKACEWLESLSGYVVCGQKANIENFRKAMENMSNKQGNKRKRETTTAIQTNEKSANSVSITEGRTDVTDGTLPDGAIIMQ